MLTVNEIFSDDNVKRIADIAFNSFSKKANPYNIDVEFELKKGKMVSPDTNTQYRFNSDESEWLASWLEDLRDTKFEEGDKEKMYAFEEKIADILQKDHEEDIRLILRDNILAVEIPEEKKDFLSIIFPMDILRVRSVVMNPGFDYTGGYHIVVRKDAPEDYIPRKQVAQELISIHMKTGMEFDDIIQQKKEEGDEAYQYVTGCTKKYFDAQFTIEMYVDYSPAPPQDIKNALEN